jgi:hypothetical protein
MCASDARGVHGDLGMSWTFAVATCRCIGDRMTTTSYIVEGDAHGARCVSAPDAPELMERAQETQRAVAIDDAVVEAGIVNDEVYVLVLRRGEVLALGPSLTETVVDAGPMTPTPSATVVFGPSAVLAIADEWAQSPARRHPSMLSLRTDGQSPYPPHRSPIGTAPLQALATAPARWSRPFAAVDEDCRRPLFVSAHDGVRRPSVTVTIAALSPLLATDDVIQWHAILAAGGEVRFRAGVSELVGAIVGFVGDLAPAVIDDPVSGERFGCAQPLMTSLCMRDLTKRRQ